MLLVGWLGVAVGVGLAGLPSAHAEAAAPCSNPRVSVEGELPAAWAAELSRVCVDIAHWRDVDRSATLRLYMRSDGADIDVTSGDGRVARRHVVMPADLWLVVEALVVMPPATPRADAGPSETPARPVPTPEESRSEPVRSVVAAPLVELGGDLTGRVSGREAYLSVGAEAWAAMRPGPWVLGLIARWDTLEAPANNPSPSFEMDTAGAGFMIARRTPMSHALSLDVGASAGLVTEAQSVEVPDGERAGVATDVRLGTLARAQIGASRLRFNAGVEAELSPMRLRRSQRIDDALPVLPAWSICLALGVAGDP